MRKEFGEFLRGLREARGTTLRRFALDIGMDPSNYAKFELGESVPASEAVLARLAEGLGISPATDDRWPLLVYHANAARGEIPTDVMARDDIARHLPAFFARLRDRQVQSVDELYDVFVDVAKGNP